MSIAPAAEPSPNHGVSFYDDATALVEQVAGFALEGLLAGEAVLLVVTAERRAGLEEALDRHQGTGRAAVARGDLVWLDATSTEERVVIDDEPDPRRLDAVVGSVVEDLTRDGRPVRVFGEMVAMLWERGHVAGAIELESLWNEYVQGRPISLMCAYTLDSFAGADDLTAAAAICDQHSHVATPTRYPHRPEGVRLAELTDRSRTFLPAHSAVAAVRRFVEETVAAWGADSTVVDDATLVASELATNALLHAGSPFRVTLQRGEGSVRLHVRDTSPTPPTRRSPGVELTTGRGIAMVHAIAEEWGTEVRADGKVVWAELAVDAS